MQACRSFGMSKAAYGWVARAPTSTLFTKLWWVHVSSCRIRVASLFGGGMHFDILFGTQLVGLVSRVQLRRRFRRPSCACRGWTRPFAHEFGVIKRLVWCLI